MTEGEHRTGKLGNWEGGKTEGGWRATVGGGGGTKVWEVG